MARELPRIEALRVAGPSTLCVCWQGKTGADCVNLAGWIATGGNVLAPLRDPHVFARAAIYDNGAAVTWDDGEGELSIDALHLQKLAG